MSGWMALLLGITLLLGGIMTLRNGLEVAFGQKMRPFLLAAAGTPYRGLLAGIFAAALLQSSTAVSLIVIGLVSASCLSFRNALGLILGANIGTCATVQILTLSLPVEYIVPAAVLCLALTFFQPIRYYAVAATGLLALFAALALLETGFTTLISGSAIQALFAASRTMPFYALAAGIGVTFLFQSSSAATAILMTLADEGLVNLTTAAYIVYGNNIGSCLSSLAVSIVTPPAARQVAAAHILLNIIGVVIFWPLTNCLVLFAHWVTTDFAAGVAFLHTLFNVLSSILVLPFIHRFAQLIEWIVPGKR